NDISLASLNLLISLTESQFNRRGGRGSNLDRMPDAIHERTRVTSTLTMRSTKRDALCQPTPPPSSRNREKAPEIPGPYLLLAFTLALSAAFFSSSYLILNHSAHSNTSDVDRRSSSSATVIPPRVSAILKRSCRSLSLRSFLHQPPRRSSGAEPPNPVGPQSYR